MIPLTTWVFDGGLLHKFVVSCIMKIFKLNCKIYYDKSKSRMKFINKQRCLILIILKFNFFLYAYNYIVLTNDKYHHAHVNIHTFYNIITAGIHRNYDVKLQNCVHFELKVHKLNICNK